MTGILKTRRGFHKSVFCFCIRECDADHNGWCLKSHRKELEQRILPKLIRDRKTILPDHREVLQACSGTDGLSQRLREPDDRLNAEAEAVRELIARNARAALNQDQTIPTGLTPPVFPGFPMMP